MNDTKTNSEVESPEIVLEFKRWFSFFTLAAVLIISWFSIFGAIVPYLTTGDFNQVWPANKGSEMKKMYVFIASCICALGFPTLVPAFYHGNVYIFGDRIELRPYLQIFSKRIIYFDTLNVTDRSGRGMLLTNSVLPEWWKSPFEYWKEASWFGISVPFSGICLINPESLPEALKTIREKSKSLKDF